MAFSRREFLRNAALSGAALGGALSSGGFLTPAVAATPVKETLSKLSGKTMTATSWGGSFQDAQRNAWFTPFAKEAGITVNEDTDPSDARIAAMVKNNAVIWDVCDVGLEQTFSAGEAGYLAPLDYNVIDTDGIPSAFVTKYGIGNIAWASVVAYRTDAIKGDVPTSVVDLWDLKRFPGKRTMRDYPLDAIPWALLAAGVPKDQIYPITDEKLDTAFKKLDEIKNDTIWWSAGAQPAQLLSSKEVAIAHIWNGRVGTLLDEMVPVEMIWKDAHLLVDAWAIPNHAPNNDVGMAFVAWASQPENNARISAEIAYGPVNKKAIPLASKKYENLLPTSHFDEMLVCDYNWWGPNVARMLERWQEWKTM
ncbi:extracellular solute-binding protein [Rhizobium lusitanum]|uniref:Extracellular solute-binding protein n=1 Tax=Rhizobium lusitanum TaxID=293958 RepID=A0A6L9UCS0_9HYPH|nr:ABC transporter substrate-binding protein [Rhizobium lusitanum]NEI73683.1 extracellular solute-binding protein [Rhizobium lusitanum]